LDVGDPFPAWELTGQFDESHRLPGNPTEVVVFSRSKQADESLSSVLESVAGERLIRGEVIYLADISGMPGMIRRLFALPAPGDRDYPVVLIREEGLSVRLVTQTDCLALYRLEQSRVVSREDLCVEKAPFEGRGSTPLAEAYMLVLFCSSITVSGPVALRSAGLWITRFRPLRLAASKASSAR